jgi:hypothetical protein
MLSTVHPREMATEFARCRPIGRRVCVPPPAVRKYCVAAMHGLRGGIAESDGIKGDCARVVLAMKM